MTNSFVATGVRFYSSFIRFLSGETGKTRRERILIGIVGVGWLTWISSPFLLLGRLGYVRGFEFGDAIYPQLAYIARMLRAGHFSLWLPAQAGGTDLLGNLNTPYLNILLFVLLPPWLAHSLIFTIVVGVGGLSTYLLLRRSFNCSVLLACAGGFFYGSWFQITFGGLVLAYAGGVAYALAPLLLDRLLRARRLTLKTMTLSVVLGLAFAVGGHFTWSVFIAGTVFIFAMLLAPRRLLRWLPHFGIVTFITALCQLPLFLANVQTVSVSARKLETYYRSNKPLALIQHYFTENPSFSPYDELVFACALLAGLAVILSNRRWRALKRAWPALASALLFFLLPVIDVAVLYALSVLHVGGFSLDASGGFGGPFDSRLRHSHAFVASVSAALSAELFWREVLSSAVDGLRGVEWRGIVRLHGIDPNGTTTRTGSVVTECRRWLDEFGLPAMLRKIRFVHLRRIGEIVLVIVVLCGALGEALHLFDLTRENILSMRRMAVNGMNFSAYYRHPQLLELAVRNPDVETFRVATVQLVGLETLGGDEPREASLYAGFQGTYGFEIADAYMSNLTGRSVNFWDLAITGHPAFPRAGFDEAYRQRFLFPFHAFLQKLYLFQPIGTGQVGTDGCIRQTTPIEFAASYNLDMLSLDNVKFIVSGFPLRDRRLTLLESGLRDELGALQCAPEAIRLEAFRTRGLVGRPLFIYRNDEVAPRVFAPQALEIAADESAVYGALTSRSIAELRRVALVAKMDLPANLAHAGGDLQVNIEKVTVLRGDHLQIETSSDAGGILIVSNSYSPYWHAEADGQPLPLFPAYHTFIGISVPPGRHAIDLLYRPPYARLLGYGKSD